jgi:ribonuclease HII
MEIFQESKKFPPEEKYSLTDQIRRASRSVATNIGQGFEENSIQRCSSVRCQTLMVKERKLKFGAQACGYISEQKQKEWLEEYEEVGRMLGGMIAHPERFCH